ncbi:MAG: hypothetical protein ABI413_21430 [Ktedonobacteraceae bacterium]
MHSTSPSSNQWSETESNLFLNVAEIFVPARAEQTSLQEYITRFLDEVHVMLPRLERALTINSLSM